MNIVKVKTSQGYLNKNIGCEEASDKIIEELKNIWSREDGINKEHKVSEVKIINGNIDETNKNIENSFGNIFIGGDHSISYNLVKSLVNILRMNILEVYFVQK